MRTLHWKQSISKVEPDRILLRGYRIEEIMGKISFSSAVFLTLMGRLPDPRWDRLLDAMLVSSIDHGVTPPSILTAIHAASGGACMNASIAAGVIAIARHHGGAIEECMEMLNEALGRVREQKESDADAAAWIVREYRNRGKRVAGYGHKIHIEDPRALRLYALAKQAELDLRYFSIARAVEKAIAKIHGRRLTINVLGAMSAILCEMGFPPALGNVFFILSRIPGIAAHVHEEGTRQQPMRMIHPTDNAYDGPPERSLESEERE